MDDSKDINDIYLTEDNNQLDNDLFNEDINEAEYCETIALKLSPYYNKNILPFNLYIKDSLPIIFEALVEIERIRPNNPVEFFCVYILNKHKATANN